MANKTLSVSLDKELICRIKEVAGWEKRSVSQWVEIKLAEPLGIHRLLPQYGAVIKPETEDE